MDIKDVKTGDTFLVRNKKAWLSKMICAVMTHWGKMKGYPTNLVFSHAGRFVWIADELYLFGSVENGYNPILFTVHYDWNNDDFAVMRRKTPLSDVEEKQTTNFVLHLDTVSVGYQYWNFVQWLMLVYLHINTFKKDSDRFTYCYESERMSRKNLNPAWYGNVAESDIFELLYDQNYDIIYKSKQ
jgi:hypothetical protein